MLDTADLHTTSAAAETVPPTGANVSEFTLANGLKVVVIPDRRAPVVTHMVWYKNGAADDPPGKSGIAHFLEHLMFKGTPLNPKGSFSHKVAALGGQENAFTSMDYTAYFQRVSAEHLKTMMAFEADRMVNLQLTDEEVLPERDVVLEERRMRTDSDPSAQLSESVAATLFANHPYGTPIIGWRHEIEDLWRTDALAYYGRFYTPENAILVVAGDVAADEVRQLADETYGQVPSRGAAPVRMRRREPDPTAHRRVEVIDPKVEQPSFQRHWLVPSYTSGDEKEAFALDVLAQLLGGSNASRLTKILVNAQQLAVSAGCWYMGSAMDRTRLAVYAIPREGVSLTDLETAAQRVVDDLAKGIPDDELERAKTRLVADAIYAQDSQATLARMYGSALATGSTVEDVQRWPAGIESVTAADVIAVARKYLKARFAVTGHLLKDTGSNDGDDTL